MLLMLLLDTALAAAPPDVPEVPEPVQKCQADEAACEVDADEGSLDVVVEVEGLLTETGPLGAAELRLELPSDAWFGGSARLQDGSQLGRIEGGVDVLGGGKAHLRLGALAGLEASGRAAPDAQVGGVIALGWTGEVIRLDGRLRTVFSGHKLETFTLEQEVQVGVRVVGPVSLTASWLRVGTGPTAVNGGGVGLGLRF